MSEYHVACGGYNWNLKDGRKVRLKIEIDDYKN